MCFVHEGASLSLCTVMEDKIAPMAGIWKGQTKQVISLIISLVCFKWMLIWVLKPLRDILEWKLGY